MDWTTQKVMGILLLLYLPVILKWYRHGHQDYWRNADWVAFSCFTVISLGTMSGGWKIVKTMGSRITKVTPLGVAAETAGALTLYLTGKWLRIPVSTAHNHRSYYWRWIGKTLVRRSLGSNKVCWWHGFNPVSAALAAIYRYSVLCCIKLIKL